MATDGAKLLRFVRFSNLKRWSVRECSFVGQVAGLPLVRLSKVLKLIRHPITIKDGEVYARVTVHLYGAGISLRDKIYGKDIGTKHQFVATAGQLIVSRIDARNGAFGIISRELHGAVVTNDFLLFDVKNVLPEYLLLVLSSQRFLDYWQNRSSGSTNRQRISVSEVLEAEVVLPEINIQRKIAKKYNDAKKLARAAERECIEQYEVLESKIRKVLNVSSRTTATKNILSFVPFQYVSRWDVNYLTRRVAIDSIYPLVTLARVIKNFLKDGEGRSLRKYVEKDSDQEYLYVGMEQVEKNIGKCNPNVVSGKAIRSQVVLVPRGYVLYGKLRPYLNKYWVNDLSVDNVVCSPEFFVFDTKNIVKEYLLAVLSSGIIQCQLPSLYRGARMPRISEEDFLHLLIPLPPKDVQHKLADIYKNSLLRIDDLRCKIKAFHMRAKQAVDAIYQDGHC